MPTQSGYSEFLIHQEVIMTKNPKIKQIMRLLTSVLFCFATLSGFARSYYQLPVHHPIHYKPVTNHLLPSGLSPQQIQIAYGFHTISAQGKGQTIAIVDAFDNPRIEADLAVFNKQFGLPECTTKNGCFKKIFTQKRTV